MKQRHLDGNNSNKVTIQKPAANSKVHFLTYIRQISGALASDYKPAAEIAVCF